MSLSLNIGFSWAILDAFEKTGGFTHRLIISISG